MHIQYSEFLGYCNEMCVIYGHRWLKEFGGVRSLSDANRAHLTGLYLLSDKTADVSELSDGRNSDLLMGLLAFYLCKKEDASKRLLHVLEQCAITRYEDAINAHLETQWIEYRYEFYGRPANEELELDNLNRTRDMQEARI
jgi:hypothetical protein